MRYQVLVRLKPGVLDVQGKAVETGLRDGKFSGISNVRVGKVIELDLDDGLSAETARQKIDEICKALLANTVIEQYEIKEA